MNVLLIIRLANLSSCRFSRSEADKVAMQRRSNATQMNHQDNELDQVVNVEKNRRITLGLLYPAFCNFQALRNNLLN
jgi:hypothetical protein